MATLEQCQREYDNRQPPEPPDDCPDCVDGGNCNDCERPKEMAQSAAEDKADWLYEQEKDRRNTTL